MSFSRRNLLACALALPLALGATFAQAEMDDGVKRLAIQVSDGDPATFTKALNVATNFARGMSEKGEMVEVDVTFSACGNTIAGMTKKEGKAPPITGYAKVVPAGVIRLMELESDGYFVIRP